LSREFAQVPALASLANSGQDYPNVTVEMWGPVSARLIEALERALAEPLIVNT
jgi:hypothetical protein